MQRLLKHVASQNGADILGNGLHSTSAWIHDDSTEDAEPPDEDWKRWGKNQTVRLATVQHENLALQQQVQQEQDSLRALHEHCKSLQAEIQDLRSSEETKQTSAEIPAAAHPGGLVDGRQLTTLRNKVDNMHLRLRIQVDNMGNGLVQKTEILRRNLRGCVTGADNFNKESVEHSMVLTSLVCNELCYCLRGLVDVVGKSLPQLSVEILGREEAKQVKSFTMPMPEYACCVFCSNYFKEGDVQIPLSGDPQTAFLTCRDCMANTLESDSSTKALGILRQSFPNTCKPNLDLVPEPYHGCSFEDQVRWDLIIVAAGAEKIHQKFFVKHHKWLWSWWNAQMGKETAEDEGQQEPPFSPPPEPPDGQLDVGDSDQGSDGGARSKSASPFTGVLQSATTHQISDLEGMAFENFAQNNV